MGENWKKLIKRYKTDKKICNCGESYTNKEGQCPNGCSANQYEAKEYVATEVVRPGTGDDRNWYHWINEDPNKDFKKELRNLLNRYSQENNSDTPDFILARYIINCLYAFSKATRQREEWYSEK